MGKLKTKAEEKNDGGANNPPNAKPSKPSQDGAWVHLKKLSADYIESNRSKAWKYMFH